MRVLVLGASGMLGHIMLRSLARVADVVGTSRSEGVKRFFPENIASRIISGIDVLDNDCLIDVFSRVRPEVVVNCVGVVKQLSASRDPLVSLPINSLLPHRLTRLCVLSDARLIHISTDCVFSGRKGRYIERDFADADDIYGRSKFLGEVVDSESAVTLRTSIIGHELTSSHGLLSWFLDQQTSVSGFTRAIFSGLSTDELASVVKDFVLIDESLYGLYHVGSAPISKFDLLELFAKEYHHNIPIEPSDAVVIDRSLDSTRFIRATSYVAPSWPEMVSNMRVFAESDGLIN